MSEFLQHDCIRTTTKCVQGMVVGMEATVRLTSER